MSFNKVILIGNLTRDPQLKYLSNNMSVCEFGLAVNRRWRDRDGNQHDEVCFVDLAAFGRTGETINQYMSKGKPILVEGRLKFDSWTGQDGQKRSRLSVVVENFQFVGPRDDGGNGSGDARRGGNHTAPPVGNAQGAPPAANDYIPPAPSGDDIPF